MAWGEQKVVQQGHSRGFPLSLSPPHQPQQQSGSERPRLRTRLTVAVRLLLRGFPDPSTEAAYLRAAADQALVRDRVWLACHLAVAAILARLATSGHSRWA